MSGASVGVGQTTFAGITMLFSSPAGKTFYNVTAGDADCTPDSTGTSKEWAPGDKADWGTCDLEVIIEGTKIDEIDTLIDARTVATLSNTLPITTGGLTGAVVAGSAYISTHSLVSSENGVLSGPISLRWQTKPTTTVGT